MIQKFNDDFPPSHYSQAGHYTVQRYLNFLLHLGGKCFQYHAPLRRHDFYYHAPLAPNRGFNIRTFVKNFRYMHKPRP